MLTRTCTLKSGSGSLGSGKSGSGSLDFAFLLSTIL